MDAALSLDGGYSCALQALTVALLHETTQDLALSLPTTPYGKLLAIIA